MHLISRLSNDNLDTFTNLFSVSSPNQQSLRSRVFMTHIGQDSGSGTWHCSKDPTINCPHVTAARKFLKKIIQTDHAAQDDLTTDMNTPSIYPRKLDHSFAKIEDSPDLLSTNYSSCRERQTPSIVHNHSTSDVGSAANRSNHFTIIFTLACPRHHSDIGLRFLQLFRRKEHV